MVKLLYIDITTTNPIEMSTFCHYFKSFVIKSSPAKHGELSSSYSCFSA